MPEGLFALQDVFPGWEENLGLAAFGVGGQVWAGEVEAGGRDNGGGGSDRDLDAPDELAADTGPFAPDLSVGRLERGLDVVEPFGETRLHPDAPEGGGGSEKGRVGDGLGRDAGKVLVIPAQQVADEMGVAAGVHRRAGLIAIP